MDPISRALIMGAAGTGGDKVYVEDVFSTWLYTGNGSTQTITNGVDLSGKGGLVWMKGRSGATGHRFVDTVRGATKSLESSSSAVEATESTGLTSFSSTGFNLGADTDYNTTNAIYTSWTFRKAAKFFDVVTYTGTGSATTIAHNLGSVPGCIIVKQTSGGTANWFVYHSAVGTGRYLQLDTSNESQSGGTVWNNTAPTSSVFSLGTNVGVNGSGNTYVAYLFAHNAGGFGDAGDKDIISCGSYTGNGIAAGPTVTLGWEPQWLLIKQTRTDPGNENWQLLDDTRGLVSGGNDAVLIPNLTNAETSSSAFVSPTSTGFQVVTTSTAYNSDTFTYIYIAIRRGPMKTPTDATKVLKANTRTGTGANTSVTGIGFAPDLVVTKTRTSGTQDNQAFWFDRLRGNYKYISSANTNAEGGTTTGYALTGTKQETADIVQLNNINRTGDTAVDWFFRRAPGFFDVVAYSGTAQQSVNHNLGVKPELIIIKSRNNTYGWHVASTLLPSNRILYLNDSSTGNAIFPTGTWNATQFPVGWANQNISGTNFIAYLFASCPGVSKVGSYTGTGTTLSVDCGFTNGCRFVLIKRTDSTGDWYVWDTARGIVSGDDPSLLLNSTVAEVTNTDYIDPLSSGFQISSTAPAAINANGGTFIFLAVA